MKGPCKHCERDVDETEYNQFGGYHAECFDLILNRKYLEIRLDIMKDCQSLIDIKKQGHFLIKWKNLLYSFDLTAAGEEK